MTTSEKIAEGIIMTAMMYASSFVGWCIIEATMWVFS